MNSEFIATCAAIVIVTFGLFSSIAYSDWLHQSTIAKCIESGGYARIDRSRLTACEKKASQP